jgi:hypothetical protein
MAEMLLSMANSVLATRGILCVPPGVGMDSVARVATALKLKRSKLYMRAVIEEWDYERIYQELH